MNSSQLQDMVAKLRAQSAAHQANTAALKLNAYQLKQNIASFTRDLTEAENNFILLTNSTLPTATVKYLTHTELKLTGS